MQFNFSFLSSTFLHWNSSFFTRLFGTHCQGNWHDLGQSACWIVCNVCCYNIKLLCIWCKNCECFLFSEKFWFEFSEISNDKCNSIFHNFWKRVHGIILYQTFQNFLTGYFHSIWLCSQNFQIFRLNGLFRDFWKHFQEMSVSFVPVLRFLEFLVEWKVPIVSHHLIAILYPSQSPMTWGM